MFGSDKKSNQGTGPAGDKEMEYQVMPHFDVQKPAASQNKNRLPQSFGGESVHKKSGWMKILIIAAAILITLGVAGYFLYPKLFGDKNEVAPSPPPAQTINVDEPKNEPVDTDEDGLMDDKEIELGSKTDDPDSDGDGLADGDEVNIYNSDPMLADSDADSFDDGREVAREYSPIINTSEKASTVELQRWTQRIDEYGLHEPTPETLILKKEVPGQSALKTTYTNEVLQFSIDLPSMLNSRESEDGRAVGIYITGKRSSDTDVTTDPITITQAVKVESETLQDWIDGQYQIGIDYESIEIITTHDLQPIRLIGATTGEESCSKNQTFFAKDNTIIILTLVCNESQDFILLYQQVLESFKFL